MNAFASIIGDKVGDMVEGAVKKTLGIEDKEDKKKGGFKSIFGGDKDEKKDKKKKDDKDKGFFSKIFDKDDDKEEKLPKKSGFQGLFSEGGGGAMGGEEGGAMGGEEPMGGNPGQAVAVSDRDLLDDLLDVAEETSNN